MTTTRPTRIGKTTVAACVGSTFAQVRHDDRVVAIDADTAFGKLGARVDPHATASYWEIAGSPTSTSTPFAGHREPIVSDTGQSPQGAGRP